MVTAVYFQRWVGSRAVLHTPADLDRRKVSDKAISPKTSSRDQSVSSFKQRFFDDRGERTVPLSDGAHQEASTAHVHKNLLFKRNAFLRFWNKSN